MLSDRHPASSTTAGLPWLALAECPDCGDKLEAAYATGAAQCTACGRSFEPAGRGLNLLPVGVEVRTNQAAPIGRGLRQAFVGGLYTRHNRSANVRGALDRVLRSLGPDDWGINLGAAETRLHPRLLSVDIAVSPNVDAVATADRLPFRDESLACAVSQEVFEHLADPNRAARQVARVLRPGGLFYFQVPFIIGFHSGPHDYWRFTDKGVTELLQAAGFDVLEVGAAVGAGTAMYRISVEFWATIAAAIWRKLYFPAKGVAAIACAPLRWADWIATTPSETNRIAAGFYAIGRKRIED